MIHFKYKTQFVATLTFALFVMSQVSYGQSPSSSAKPDSSMEIPSNLKKKIASLSLKGFEPMTKDRFTKESLALFEGERGSPALLLGDFNGDKVEDACILIASPTQVLPLLLLSKGAKAAEVVRLESWPREKKGQLESTYLSLLAQKDVNFKNEKIKTKRDLIQVETYLGSVKAYYFDGKEIQEYKGVVP